MELKWSFIMSANYSYVHDLLYYLNSEDIVIYEEGEEGVDLTQYFSSCHLNCLIEPNDIYRKAYQLCSFINGIDFLMYDDKGCCNPIRLDRLIDIKNQKSVFYDKEISVNKIDIIFDANIKSVTNSSHIIAQVMQVVKCNKFVQNILFIVAQKIDFKRLYQALDETKFFLNSIGIKLEEIGFSKKTITDFTRTANNYQTLGLEARHGNSGWDEPKIPITLLEAQNLLTIIIRTVFEKFCNINLPIIKKVDYNNEFLF